MVAVTRSRKATMVGFRAFSSLKSRIPADPRTSAIAAAKYTLNLLSRPVCGVFLPVSSITNGCTRRSTRAISSPESLHHLLFRETKKLAARGRGPEDAGRSRDVPAAIVVGRIHGVANTALHLDAQHHGVEKLLARHRALLGQRKDCRHHWSGGMN